MTIFTPPARPAFGNWSTNQKIWYFLLENSTHNPACVSRIQHMANIGYPELPQATPYIDFKLLKIWDNLNSDIAQWVFCHDTTQTLVWTPETPLEIWHPYTGWVTLIEVQASINIQNTLPTEKKIESKKPRLVLNTLKEGSLSLQKTLSQAW